MNCPKCGSEMERKGGKSKAGIKFVCPNSKCLVFGLKGAFVLVHKGKGKSQYDFVSREVIFANAL